MSDKYNSKIARLIGKLNGVEPPRGWAITISKSCVLYSLSKDAVEADSKWVAHENCHKAQFKKYGQIGYAIRYCYQLLRYGYWNAPFEVEARKVSEQK